VSSLDSLRDQLQLYCTHLKEQLYDIINRDYKDFITIATKLEGVDIRVDHLRKPLVDLRMDLTMLNDTMVSNIQALKAKMQQREEVSNRRRMLESSLACMAKLSDVDVVLGQISSTSEIVNTNSSASRTRSRKDLSRMLEARGVSQEVFQCSELERAAVSLSSARAALHSHQSQGAEGASSIALRRSLDAQVQSQLSRLEDRLRSHTSRILSSAAGNDALSTPERRALGHLLRGMVAVGHAEDAEKLVAEALVTPLIRSHITQGKVDGTEGRGSYSGLGDALQSLLDSFSPAARQVFILSEELFSVPGGHNPEVDLVVGGVWRPVAGALQQGFSGMFNSGIARVFHRAHRNVERFLDGLGGLCGSRWEEIVRRRLEKHPSVITFRQAWKMDLHFQLRVQEVQSRVEAAVEIVSAHGMCSKVFDEVYSPRKEGEGARNISLSIPADRLSIIEEDMCGSVVQDWQLDFTRVTVAEILTCLHSDVYLPPLGGKLFSLAVRVMSCYEKHLLALAGHRASGETTAAAEGTPVKGGHSAGGSGAPVAVGDLVRCVEDLHTLTSWIVRVFAPLSRKIIIGDRLIGTDEGPIECCLQLQAEAILHVCPALWARIAGIIAAECKSGLKAVKSVAGKFRMTNKPAPDTPSGFVVTILKPLKSFVDKHGVSISKLPHTDGFSMQEWARGIVESVTTAYSQQVQALMETAQQMDSALQRRSKLRQQQATSGGSITDSEKIALQMLLDVQYYGERIREICGIDPIDMSAYSTLLREVKESKQMLESR